MALADTLKAATRVIPASILPGVATSTVTVKRPPVAGTPGARNPDGTPKTLAQFSVVATDLKLFIQEPKAGRMQFVWGPETNAQYEATTDIALDLREGDTVIVTAGDFAGVSMKVEARRVEPLGNIAVLALSATARAT